MTPAPRPPPPATSLTPPTLLLRTQRSVFAAEVRKRHLPCSGLILPPRPSPSHPSPPPPRERGTRVCTVPKTEDEAWAGPGLKRNGARGSSTRRGGAESTAEGGSSRRFAQRRNKCACVLAPRRVCGWDWGGRGWAAWPLVGPGSPSNRPRTGCCRGLRLRVLPARNNSGSPEGRVSRSRADSPAAGPKESFIFFIAHFLSLPLSLRQDGSLVRKEKEKAWACRKKTQGVALTLQLKSECPILVEFLLAQGR
ncbi:uncharacterized protein LOC121495269 [Vulpes lagopus]|uniref:uncharacterized protein LOC121495269 n=1 Tax=Vulpes lagopus TaxID=494514 RepID=UPI001BC8FDC0|nr:uncharacterized protein LOC121495269 [Vulpes lagopus]